MVSNTSDRDLKLKKRAAFYCRVSTDGQTVTNQVQELEAIAARHGWDVTNIYCDEGISGAKGKEERPGLQQLCKAIARKEMDVIAVWSVDRLGRSLPHLISLLSDIHAKQVDLYIHQQGLDTGTPSGKAMFQMMGVFAEFERSMIQERVRCGLSRARREGKQLGRPKVPPDTENAILQARARGLGIHRISKELGCGVGTVQRVLNS